MQLAKKNLSFIKRFFFFHFQGKNKRGGLKKTHFPYEKPTFSTRFFYFIPLHVSKCFCITNGAAWLSGNLACTILWITAVFHRFLSPYISLAMFPSTQREKKQEKEKKKNFFCVKGWISHAGIPYCALPFPYFRILLLCNEFELVFFFSLFLFGGDIPAFERISIHLKKGEIFDSKGLNCLTDPFILREIFFFFSSFLCVCA